MKVIAFGASNSKKSINKLMASYAANLIEGVQVELLDLNDFEAPLFSEDREMEIGQPQPAKDFLAKLESADAIVISFAEHNGSYTAAYKNLFDWCSRINQKVFQQKPAIYLSTSPGPRGAANVLAAAVNSAPHFGADVKGNLSIPSFYDNFDIENNELTDQSIKTQLVDTMGKLK
jgi:NAD(P)H-dependent FMN reductase